jgi:hypothetical protein
LRRHYNISVHLPPTGTDQATHNPTFIPSWRLFIYTINYQLLANAVLPLLNISIQIDIQQLLCGFFSITVDLFSSSSSAHCDILWTSTNRSLYTSLPVPHHLVMNSVYSRFSSSKTTYQYLSSPFPNRIHRSSSGSLKVACQNSTLSSPLIPTSSYSAACKHNIIPFDCRLKILPSFLPHLWEMDQSSESEVMWRCLHGSSTKFSSPNEARTLCTRVILFHIHPQVF